jgi:hypothetical protein
MMGLIGSTWKSSNAWSGRVLTAENLTHTRPARAGWKHDIHARYAILRQHMLRLDRTTTPTRKGGRVLVADRRADPSHGFVWW